MLHGDEFGRCGIVVIPDIVVDHLVVPHPLPGGGVESNQRIAEQVHPFSVSAIEVVLGAGGGDVDDAALRIEGDLAPGIRPPDGLPGVFRPGVVAKFTGVRDGVEAPDELAGQDAEGTDVAGG